MMLLVEGIPSLQEHCSCGSQCTTVFATHVLLVPFGIFLPQLGTGPGPVQLGRYAAARPENEDQYVILNSISAELSETPPLIGGTCILTYASTNISVYEFEAPLIIALIRVNNCQAS